MADILQILIAERDRIDLAIAALQGQKRRGRPPGSGKQAAKQTAKRGRPKMSAAQRKAASKRMQLYWAKRRKAAKRAKRAKSPKPAAAAAAKK
jgi:hypothetical protein